jgi:hypothetical protein
MARIGRRNDRDVRSADDRGQKTKAGLGARRRQHAARIVNSERAGGDAFKISDLGRIRKSSQIRPRRARPSPRLGIDPGRQVQPRRRGVLKRGGRLVKAAAVPKSADGRHRRHHQL